MFLYQGIAGLLLNLFIGTYFLLFIINDVLLFKLQLLMFIFAIGDAIDFFCIDLISSHLGKCSLIFITYL